jgi:ubiquinone/menaquinone biosynthesis C-methylase UbiE
MIDSDAHLERIRAQFGRMADVYARMRQTTDEKSLNALVSISGADAKARVLDVACGPGFLTMAFAARCGSAVGCDATEPFLVMARAEAAQRGLDNIEFRSGNAEALPFEDGTFNLVSCRAAFHHFARPDKVLAQMTRVCAPGGRLLVADMLSSADPAQAEFHNRIDRLVDPTHVRALSSAEFDEIFGAARLAVRFKTDVPIDIEVDEWLAHGGPDAATETQVRELVEAAVDTDRGGLNIRRKDGVLWFTYPTMVSVLERA